ncbi:MAG: 3-isopropylmalate dehydratase large subunit [Deltaproteobacteria bacterium]|nr:3-isopropylmalate dehydratase large subunit [Deltaproteobacteria bacterium]
MSSSGGQAASKPRTLLDKIWDSHLVLPEAEGVPSTLYVDLHLVHEVTSPQAFAELDERGLGVRRPDQTLATMDHSTPTEPGLNLVSLGKKDPQAARQLEHLEGNCQRHGIPLFGLDSSKRGIVHVIGPELGVTQPGTTIVCGDSHTSTHGAFGALAFGIGTSEVAHVLATQCLLRSRPKSFEIRVEGRLPKSVTAKDLVLAVIAKIGVDGGTGHVLEYSGSAIRSLSMEERMTVCNMSIEAGARAGLIAPDETTYEYLRGRPYAPRGEDWDRAVEAWRRLPSDPGASFDRQVVLDASTLEPMITYGTHPGMAIPIRSAIPTPEGLEPRQRSSLDKAMAYMELEPGRPLLGQAIDVVFLGSCTNSRLSDLSAAASLLKGRRVAPGVQMLVVPGSQQVKQQAEAEGLDEVFRSAGAQWRESGCSMCLAMNGDRVAPGHYSVSTSNRNFEGRQGPGARTFLASPLTAAASAVAGRVADPRELGHLDPGLGTSTGASTSDRAVQAGKEVV